MLAALHAIDAELVSTMTYQQTAGEKLGMRRAFGGAENLGCSRWAARVGDSVGKHPEDERSSSRSMRGCCFRAADRVVSVLTRSFRRKTVPPRIDLGHATQKSEYLASSTAFPFLLVQKLISSVKTSVFKRRFRAKERVYTAERLQSSDTSAALHSRGTQPDERAPTRGRNHGDVVVRLGGAPRGSGRRGVPRGEREG
jgi:hypothetical protein